MKNKIIQDRAVAYFIECCAARLLAARLRVKFRTLDRISVNTFLSLLLDWHRNCDLMWAMHPKYQLCGPNDYVLQTFRLLHYEDPNTSMDKVLHSDRAKVIHDWVFGKDYHCPVCCGTYLEVSVGVRASLFQEDGGFETDTTTSSDGSHEWGDDNRMICMTCGYQAAAREFRRPLDEMSFSNVTIVEDHIFLCSECGCRLLQRVSCGNIWSDVLTVVGDDEDTTLESIDDTADVRFECARCQNEVLNVEHDKSAMEHFVSHMESYPAAPREMYAGLHDFIGG